MFIQSVSSVFCCVGFSFFNTNGFGAAWAICNLENPYVSFFCLFFGSRLPFVFRHPCKIQSSFSFATDRRQNKITPFAPPISVLAGSGGLAGGSPFWRRREEHPLLGSALFSKIQCIRRVQMCFEFKSQSREMRTGNPQSNRVDRRVFI